jgi:hypothetical protein
MNGSIATVEAHLAASDITMASDAFANLRPGFKSTLEGLKLSARIHFAAARWEQVGVLCRILRKEHPIDPFGFTQGAESLHRQGRGAEAVRLLKDWQALMMQPDESILASIERYQITPSPVANELK